MKFRNYFKKKSFSIKNNNISVSQTKKLEILSNEHSFYDEIIPISTNNSQYSSVKLQSSNSNIISHSNNINTQSEYISIARNIKQINEPDNERINFDIKSQSQQIDMFKIYKFIVDEIKKEMRN